MNDRNIDIEQFIKNHFTSLEDGQMFAISGLLSEYPAWIVKSGGRTGVAIPYMGEKKFYAKFAKVELERVQSPKEQGYWLFLSMDSDESKEIKLQFATICKDFIRIGSNGDIRQETAKHPEIWWAKWRSLLGDSAHSQMVYDLVGELIVWKYLLKQGYNPLWTGSNKKRIDFTAGAKKWEVKSTTNRTKLLVTVHGQYQLFAKAGESLQLVFCRLEESDKGETVNTLAESLKTIGIDAVFLEKELKALGLREGSIARNRRFQLLEIRVYDVDDNFPAITPKSFVEGKFPAGIIELDYTIDLANIAFSTWENV